MKAVVLAAGIASRLRPLTEATPKALLPVGGEALLGRTLRHLEANGVRDIVLVTGYRAAQIRAFAASRFPGLSLAFIHNPVYETTNNIYSLWLAREEVLGGKMILLDGDILFDGRILGLLLESGHEACLAVDTRPGLGEEEMKVAVDDAGRVVAISKSIPPGEAFGESIGIELFGPDSLAALYREVERRIVDRGEVGSFYEAAFQSWIDGGGILRAVPIGPYKAIEIDTAEDFKTAERTVLPHIS